MINWVEKTPTKHQILDCHVRVESMDSKLAPINVSFHYRPYLLDESTNHQLFSFNLLPFFFIQHCLLYSTLMIFWFDTNTITNTNTCTNTNNNNIITTINININIKTLTQTTTPPIRIITNIDTNRCSSPLWLIYSSRQRHSIKRSMWVLTDQGMEGLEMIFHLWVWVWA